MAFFGIVLFPSTSRAISFVVLPFVNALPHGTSFIPALLFETIRSLFLCRETGRGRLGCCVHSYSCGSVPICVSLLGISRWAL